MSKTIDRPAKPTGHRGFAKISAIEGIHLSSEMQKDLQELDAKGASPSERQEFIARKHGRRS